MSTDIVVESTTMASDSTTVMAVETTSDVHLTPLDASTHFVPNHISGGSVDLNYPAFSNEGVAVDVPIENVKADHVIIDVDDVGDLGTQIQEALNKDPVQDPDQNLGFEKRILQTYTGERPFKGAVEMYKMFLYNAIQHAKGHLLMHPHHTYAKVNIPLFSTFVISCHDQFGNEVLKKYPVHVLHYGPIINNTKATPGLSDQERYWAGFLDRDTSIWVHVNGEGKVPGGIGNGYGGTACSPFRDAQVRLLQEEGLYLIDASDVFRDTKTGKLFYNIIIHLYRNKPLNGPFPAKHGYGYIPNLGPAAKHKIGPDFSPADFPALPPPRHPRHCKPNAYVYKKPVSSESQDVETPAQAQSTDIGDFV